MKPSLTPKPKSRLWLYGLLIVAVVVVMLSLHRCRDLNFGRHPGQDPTDTIRVAMQYAPGSFFMVGDSLGGVDYDALRRLGLPYKIYPITTAAEGLEGLRTGRFDVVVADMPQTADSAGEFIFTSPVYVDRQVLVQLADSTRPHISSPIELDGDSVAVVANSPMTARLRNLSDELGITIHPSERQATAEQLLTAMAGGSDTTIRYVVTNRSIARQMAQSHPNLDYSVEVSLSQFQPWILAKQNTALRDTINAHLHHEK